MISYAQNREDVLLDRLYPKAHKGFYIDVGASDPVDMSITKHFYDLGWSGVNVEPVTPSFEVLREARPRDINLNVGVSDEPGSLQFFECPPPHGSASTFSAAQADWHRETGLSFEAREVPVITLARLCEEHVDRTIDFLSVDVEGFERQVLAGNDWTRWRPRVVVVEATQPRTTIPTHEEWEPILLEADYVFAAFDGLNRYYVRFEDSELVAMLATPANVFDDYVPYEYARQIESCRWQLDANQRQLAAADAVNQTLTAEAHAFAQQLQIVRDHYSRLENDYRNLEIAFDTLRTEYQAARSHMAETRGLYEHVYQEVTAARSQALAALDLFDAVGPAGLGVARRLTTLSSRFPRGSEMVKRSLKTGMAAKRKLAGSS
ncbi:MAG: FkbM family methyltransferase [Actinomycetota bacterium]|nr:FkbM family methyltransferase [Actinomycetota bacterium]